ncbi:MAG: glycosyltransferase [Verrucomicrobiota bacterium]
MKLSVIICTHNPREDYLRRVLDALEAQTLSHDQWEVLLIDNASREPLAKTWHLSKLPNARHVREETLGLTPARLRGIREAAGDVLVFVDDDNVLRPDFLAECLEIERDWPLLGAWGGRQLAEYEHQPPREAWKRRLFDKKFVRDVWSNNYDRNTTPIGAGVCIRRGVAEQYARLAQSDPVRLDLDRRGTALNSGGDIDMAYVACDMGLGLGIFCRLELVHLIPSARMEDAYVYRLAEGYGHANTILDSLRGKTPPYRPVSDWIANFFRRFRFPREEWNYKAAHDAGRQRAIRELRSGERPGRPSAS